MAQNDHGESKAWPNLVDKEFSEEGKLDIINFCDTYVLPYMSGARVLGYVPVKDVTYNKKGYKDPYGNDFRGSALDTNFKNYTIELKNGQILYFTYFKSGGGSNTFSMIAVYVDVNGHKGPNKVARDAFLLWYRLNEGRIVPYGYGYSSTTIKDNCSKNGTHPNHDWFQFCPSRIVQDGWQISKDYPW